MLRRLNSRPLQILLLVSILALSGLVHGVNMFRFPYYENDEGVYLSQAWSFLTQGKLAPYTYWYDHSPAGWIFTSLWVFLTGGFFRFGFSLNSGRVFMLVLQLLSTFFVYQIAFRLTKSRFPGIIAALFFALSPLGVYFHRRLLLDNIMTFWFLWAYYLVLGSGRRLTHFIASAVSFGIAVLTKENAIFFIPGFLFTLLFNVHRHHQRFVIVKWFLIVALVVSTYFLYALLKGEMFATGTLLGGSSPHVSLLETLHYQLSRKGGSFFDLKSSFWTNFNLWINRDFIIIIFGFIANIALFYIAIFKRHKRYLALTLFGLSFWYFLIRGGIVIEFYIVPLLPILALCLGIYFFELSQTIHFFSRHFPRRLFLLVVMLAIIFGYFTYYQHNIFYGRQNAFYYFFQSNQTLAQIQAVDWIRQHVSLNSIIIIDNYGYLDFHAPDNPSGRVFPNAHWYWKVDLDPDIKNGILHNQPQSIDYIAKTPQMDGDLLMGSSPLTQTALNHASPVYEPSSDGWGVDIWSTRYPVKILNRSWESYKKDFILADGRVIDPNKGQSITSEGQSYALLRSVWLNDRSTFDTVWHWTKSNLLLPTNVFAWKWENNAVVDSGSAADADTDIAVSLLFAAKKWSDPAYLAAAQTIINGIWQEEVKDFQGQFYLVPGNWAKSKPDVIINPSYFFPSAYRIFSEVDPSHPWLNVVDSSYLSLFGCSGSKLNAASSVFLPPNWCQMTSDGKFIPATDPNLASTEYSYDAMRTMWRLALDARWYQDNRAKDYLALAADFFEKELSTQKKILVGYTHSGQPWENYESVIGYATAICSFADSNSSLSDSVYQHQIESKFYENTSDNTSYWEDPKNYYVQNWAWFGTALYSHSLPNLWQQP